MSTNALTISQMNNTNSRVQDMGKDTSKVFSGGSQSETNKQLYGESAKFFADAIKERLEKDRSYTLIDVGAFQGELLTNILNHLPEHNFTTIAVDINEEALSNNIVAHHKIFAEAESLPFETNSINLAIIRYVLQWNPPEKQKLILQELSRVVNKFTVIEHAGADVVDTGLWRERMDNLLSGKDIPKIKRHGHFFSSRDEIETWMSEAGINFERLKDRVIADGADIFIERYSLDAGEAGKAKEILGEKNYFRQTGWVVYPR